MHHLLKHINKAKPGNYTVCISLQVASLLILAVYDVITCIDFYVIFNVIEDVIQKVQRHDDLTCREIGNVYQVNVQYCS